MLSFVKYVFFSSTLDSRFAITFDGWSNSSLNGFYPMTSHWVCRESAKPMSMLIDFFHVFPGDGVGKRCGQALFMRLKSFGISSHISSITCDGASDAIIASNELGRLLHDMHGDDILPSSNMLRCMVHVFQLGIKVALEVISPSTMKFRFWYPYVLVKLVELYLESILNQCMSMESRSHLVLISLRDGIPP